MIYNSLINQIKEMSLLMVYSLHSMFCGDDYVYIR